MSNPALSLIETIAATRAELRSDASRQEAFQRLQEWQVVRLRSTYDDYYRETRYRKALDFFIRDLYGPHDFGERDRELQNVIRTWHRMMPAGAFDAVTRALELEALSQSLDLDVLGALDGVAIDEATYAAAYRKANRRADRQRQIWLIVSAGRSLDELIRYPMIATALRLARVPARLAGALTLHDFIERGYAAFAQMQGAEDLLRVIERRETTIMQNLFAGRTKPFAVDEPETRSRENG